MAQARGGDLLSVTIEDEAVLHAAYMPFVAGGGLFIPTAKHFRLGDEVFVLLRLMDEPAGIPFAGTVVWITPEGARGGAVAGVGVRFGEGDDVVRRRIEERLAGIGGAFDGRATYTM